MRVALGGRSTFAVAVCAYSHSADSRPVGLRDTARAPCPVSLKFRKWSLTFDV